VSAAAPPVLCRDAARAHRLGVLLMVAAAVAFSTAGFFTRLITLDAPALLFWRGIFSGLTIAAFVVWRERGAMRPWRTIGWPGLLLALTSSLAMISFVWSLRLSSVAEVSVIYATVPLGTAGLGWLLLREPAGWPVLAACLAVLAGMAVMMSGGQAQAHLFGDLVAVLMTVMSALFMVGLRWRRHSSAEPAVALSAFLTSVLVAAWAHPFHASAYQIALTALFGIIQNGFGIILMVLGSRLVTANETALYGAIDAPLAPLWVWLAFGEAPSPRTLAGGLVIFAAVGAFIVYGPREGR
jgi:drug/metabolite transporter (DMT)-like permease